MARSLKAAVQDRNRLVQLYHSVPDDKPDAAQQVIRDIKRVETEIERMRNPAPPPRSSWTLYAGLVVATALASGVAAYFGGVYLK